MVDIQSATAEIRRGNKKDKRKIENEKSQGKNMSDCPHLLHREAITVIVAQQ